jgi:hypothetical protein
VGSQVRINRVLAPSHTGCFPSFFEKGVFQNGEYQLIDLIGIILVALLGFLPLIVIHIVHRPVRMSLPRRAVWRLSAIKTSLLVTLTDWISSIVI